MRRAATIAAVLLAALAIGACGDSPEDEARDDGEQVGEAVRALFDADSPQAAQAAVDDLRTAVDEVEQDTRDQVQDQLQALSATLTRAVEAYRTGQAATTGSEVEAARNDLRAAVQEIRAQADAFRSGSDSIANEFWRGFEDGYD